MSEQWLRPCLWTQLVNRSRISVAINMWIIIVLLELPFFLLFLFLFLVLFDSNKQDLKVFYTNWNEINMTFFLLFFIHFLFNIFFFILNTIPIPLPPLLLPYHPKCTRSLLILETKQGWAWLNLDGRPPFLVGRWSGSPHLTFPFLVTAILTLQSWLLALWPAADINLSICVISEKLGLPKDIF